MLRPVVKALLGHYRRHPLQLVLVWFGLTLGVSIFVGVAAVNQHARQSYMDGEKLFSNPLPYRIRPKHSANRIPQGFYVQLRREGFNQCIPMDRLRVETKSGRDLSIVGVEPVATMGLEYGGDKTESLMQLMQSPKPLMINEELISYLGKKSGDYIELIDGSRIGPLVVDKTDVLSGTQIVADISKVRTIRKEGGFSFLACEDMPAGKLLDLKNKLPNGMELTKSSRSELESLTQAFHLNLSALGMLSFVVGLFIFYQAMSLSLIQRQPLVGIMRQAGVSNWQLTKAMAIELTTLILIGWLFGNAIGLFLANQLIPSVSTTLSDLYNAQVSLTVDWSWEWSRRSLIMAIAGTLLSCSWPVVRLIKTPPIRLSAKLSLVRFAGREFAWQAMAAGVLCVAAIALYQLPAKPVYGFLIVALFLLSVALAVPYIIFKIFNSLSFTLRWVKVRWFFSEAASSMSFRGVAVMAFMLAMAANITVETLVGSFRETTDRWLTQKLASDVYIFPTNSSAARMSNWLSKQPEVESVWWRWEIDVPTNDEVLEVVSTGNSIGEKDAMTVKIAVPDFWYQLHSSKSVLVSEAMAIKEHIRPGDNLYLGASMQDAWQVVGIYYDYGNPYNQVLMSHRNWMGRFSGQGNVGLGVNLKGDDSPDKLLARLQSTYSLSSERVLDNSNIHSQAMRVFDRTFVIADTLGDLTLGVAVLGIFFATLAGEVSKQKNTALMRCLGLSGPELILMSGLQLLLFGVISAMIALPLGYALAKVMVEVVLKASFGWTMHLYVIPWNYLNTFAWSMLALVLAGILPTIGMLRRTPMKSLRDAL